MGKIAKRSSSLVENVKMWKEIKNVKMGGEFEKSVDQNASSLCKHQDSLIQDRASRRSDPAINQVDTMETLSPPLLPDIGIGARAGELYVPTESEVWLPSP